MKRFGIYLFVSIALIVLVSTSTIQKSVYDIHINKNGHKKDFKINEIDNRMYLSDEKKSLLKRALFRKIEKYEVSFTKGGSFLDSKSIYRIYLKKYVLEVKLEGNARGLEKFVFESLHSFNTDSSLRSCKYKIIFNTLTTNMKFCYISKKEIDIDIEHILLK